MVLQQQLRTAALCASATPTTEFTYLQAAAKHLLKRRGDSVAPRVVHTRTTRSLVFRNTPKLVAQRAPAGISSKKADPKRASRVVLPRMRPNKKAFKPRIQVFGFLNKTLRSLAEPNYTAASLHAVATLNRQDRHYREVQFYHSRPKMRLPQTSITRNRRRKAGLVTFARNSLQQPRTLLGQARALLPPVNAYSRATVKHIVGFAPRATSLAVYERRANLLPIF